MTKDETIKHLRSLADALEQGKTVQRKFRPNKWEDVALIPTFTAPIQCYRVKPEPREWWLAKDKHGLITPWSFEIESKGNEVIHVREVLDE